MKVISIRHNVSENVILSPSSEDNSTLFTCAGFDYIILNTASWSTGSRNRTKSFGSLKEMSCFDRLRSYFNKLNAGGYLSDDDYAIAWQASLDLEATVEHGGNRASKMSASIKVDNNSLQWIGHAAHEMQESEYPQILKPQCC